MIIDTHTHFYDPTRPEGVPWPNPNDEVLYRRVMPEDYKALAVPEGATGTVVVEASKWLEDNQWILDLAAEEPFIVGFVGHLEPTADFEDNLNRFSANPLFRGIRLGGGHLQAIGDRTFLASIEKLAAKELTLDLLINPEALSSLPRWLNTHQRCASSSTILPVSEYRSNLLTRHGFQRSVKWLAIRTSTARSQD